MIMEIIKYLEENDIETISREIDLMGFRGIFIVWNSCFGKEQRQNEKYLSQEVRKHTIEYSQRVWKKY